jgi:heat shock protein HslJ
MVLITLPRVLAAVCVASALGGCATHSGKAQARGPAASNAATTSDSLAQTGWELTRWATQSGAAKTLPSGNPIRLNFLASGHEYGVTGFSGCNRYSGTYKLADRKLFITVRATTRMQCDAPGVSDVEKAYLGSLGKIASFTLDNGGAPRQMIITLADGDALTFQRREDPPSS